MSTTSNTRHDDDARQGSVVKQLAPVAYVLGIALIVAYFVGLALAWSNIGGSDSEWGRRLQLLGGLEALAFAAAGAILGTTVQRQLTQKEEQRATRAERQADASAADAEKGRAVLNLVEAKAGISADDSKGELKAKGFGRGQPDPVAAAFQDVLGLASRYDAKRAP